MYFPVVAVLPVHAVPLSFVYLTSRLLLKCGYLLLQMGPTLAQVAPFVESSPVTEFARAFSCTFLLNILILSLLKFLKSE